MGKLTDTQLYEASIKLQGKFKVVPTKDFIEYLANGLQYEPAGLESIASIAERTFPEEVAEIRASRFDSGLIEGK